MKSNLRIVAGVLMAPLAVLFLLFSALANGIGSMLLAAGIPAEEISREAVQISILIVMPEWLLWIGGIAAGMFLAGLLLFLATKPFDNIH